MEPDKDPVTWGPEGQEGSIRSRTGAPSGLTHPLE